MALKASKTADVENRERILERDLEEAEECGDPVGVWVKHISWLEEKGLNGQESYPNALKRCIAYFGQIPHYNSDIRLAEIYIKLAKRCGDPTLLYKHMLEREVGTQHAVVYSAYASALEARGDKEEAVGILELGVAKGAHPIKRLQKQLETMKGQSLSKPAAAQREGQQKPAMPNPSKNLINEKSDRNEAFYSQPGVVVMYPKELVYPTEGGEFQLEQLRGQLPQYKPVFPDQLSLSGGEMEMEMTVADMGNITMNVPVVQGLFGKGRGEKAGVIQRKAADVVDQENRENASVLKPLPVHKAQRKPLQLIEPQPPQEQAPTAEEELEQLCRQKVLALPQQKPALVLEPQKDDMDDIEREIEQLLISKPRSKSVEQVSRSQLVEQVSVVHKENLSLLRDQENRPPLLTKPCTFEFTPNTVDSSINWPIRGAKNASGVTTKLSFSDAESLSSSRVHSLAEDSATGSSRLGGLSATLECEKRVKLTREQMRFENQFANNSETDPSFSREASQSQSSFDVFHDSWASQSRNASNRQNSSTFRPTIATAQPRRAPQERPKPAAGIREPSFNCSYDRSQSFQPSQSNISSFSVYEDSQESSFVPFHDSWASRSKNASGVARTSLMKTEETQSLVSGDREPGLRYHAPLGVPVVPRTEENDLANATADQEFTQFDIRHPRQFEPASTPMVERIDFTFNMSVIPSDVPKAEEQPLAPPHRSTAGQLGNLSTIIEESGSYKSSGSSSASSQHSTASSVPPDSLASSHQIEDINPFQMPHVNFMLNSVGFPIQKLQRVGAAVPRFTPGHSVTLGDESFSALKKITDGGFATLFTVRLEDKLKVLKVQTPPMEWEVAVVEELHTRLRTSGSALLSPCFMEIERAYSFSNTSVIVTGYHSFGTLLDVANAHRVARSSVPEALVLYYTRELLTMVAALHECGIIHADIKPDNLMSRDIRQFSDFEQARGKGLCLIDFGRAIDTRAFPEETNFIGSCDTDCFQCVQMLEGKPWKWQVDYFGVAATIHVLLHGEYMSIAQHPATGLYKPNKALTRRFDVPLWSKFFEVLLNAQGFLPLSEFIKVLDSKLRPIKDFMYRTSVQKCQGVLTSFLAQK